MKITIKHCDTRNLNYKQKIILTRSFLACLCSIMLLMHIPVVFCSKSTNTQVPQYNTDDISTPQNNSQEKSSSTTDCQYIQKNCNATIHNKFQDSEKDTPQIIEQHAKQASQKQHQSSNQGETPDNTAQDKKLENIKDNTNNTNIQNHNANPKTQQSTQSTQPTITNLRKYVTSSQSTPQARIMIIENPIQQQNNKETSIPKLQDGHKKSCLTSNTTCFTKKQSTQNKNSKKQKKTKQRHAKNQCK